MIPERSEGSLKQGLWFVFHDGDNRIQVWASSFSGKEKVYLNGELVSEFKSYKKQSSHSFEDKNGHTYEVKFNTAWTSKGPIQCIFVKNGLIVKTLTATFEKGEGLSTKRVLTLISASFVFGLCMWWFQLPRYTLIPFTIVGLIAHFATRNYGGFVIEND